MRCRPRANDPLYAELALLERERARVMGEIERCVAGIAEGRRDDGQAD